MSIISLEEINNTSIDFKGVHILDKRKVLSFSLLVVPWLTVPLIGKNTFVRFLPVSTFIVSAFSLVSEVADKKKYWKVKNPLFPNYVLDYSYLLGFFFIVTIWIFKLTYGNFVKYLLTSIGANLILAFPIIKLFTRVGIFEFKRLRPKHFFLLTSLSSIVIFWYQRLIERIIVKEVNK
jgi:hypothetical protein